ncbi:MAG TPA: divalent metal cation transporter [Stellaceae bacterium]|nr:divalent metal cation transporter [Stellaceae bacterium]
MAGKAPAAERRFFKVLGPGLITGASDDDPSGIATYSQVGAQFGFAMSWTMLFTFPLMAAIQEISARIGRCTGHGIAANIRRHYSPWLLHGLVALVLVANTINLGADLGAIADALRLLIGGPRLVYVVSFGALCAGLEIFLKYGRYATYLRWSTLALFAYAATACIVDVQWREVIRATFVPSLAWNADYILGVVAVFGTTISPYLFFWQSSQEAEDGRVDPRSKPLVMAPLKAPAEMRRIRIDTCVGMFMSNAIGWFILVTVAATLHAHGITDIASSAQAAEALRPIGGPFTFALFAIGIIGTGMLAVPVLAGSAAYALGEALNWRLGLARHPAEAKAFYGTIAAATAVGIGLNFAPIDPVRALFWAAVVNGVVAVPVMVVTMLMARQPRVMGRFSVPLSLAIVGWLATAAMAAAVAAMAVTSFAGG